MSSAVLFHFVHSVYVRIPYCDVVRVIQPLFGALFGLCSMIVAYHSPVYSISNITSISKQNASWVYCVAICIQYIACINFFKCIEKEFYCALLSLLYCP